MCTSAARDWRVRSLRAPSSRVRRALRSAARVAARSASSTDCAFAASAAASASAQRAVAVAADSSHSFARVTAAECAARAYVVWCVSCHVGVMSVSCRCHVGVMPVSCRGGRGSGWRDDDLNRDAAGALNVHATSTPRPLGDLLGTCWGLLGWEGATLRPYDPTRTEKREARSEKRGDD